MNSKYYTGVGARATPKHILSEMTEVATELQHNGYILRSGAADGADTAFERGTNYKEIYLPWPKYNNSVDGIYITNPIAVDIARTYSPYWNSMRDSVKKLMTRNVYQVLGSNLDTPSLFLICYTDDGCETHHTRTPNTGGTGLAIELASRYNIPVINMIHTTWRSKLDRVLDNIELYSFK